MGQELVNKGQTADIRHLSIKNREHKDGDFVLEKGIFSNIFGKDIRRVFIYKKTERLAKAVHLITPAFASSSSLRDRVDAIAVGLIDAAILPLSSARSALSHELLALSSILSIARSGGLLSSMNAELIAREAHILLQEVASYEEPRLSLDEAPTISEIARMAPFIREPSSISTARPVVAKIHKKNQTVSLPETTKQTVKDIKDSRVKNRQDGILSVIKDKGEASIKDISLIIRDVSEKTIQRELQSLVETGRIIRHGERRWSRYSFQ